MYTIRHKKTRSYLSGIDGEITTENKNTASRFNTNQEALEHILINPITKNDSEWSVEFSFPQLAYRTYKCRDCDNEVEIQTTHRGDWYPDCKGSFRQIIGFPGTRIRKQTVHEFICDN